MGIYIEFIIERHLMTVCWNSVFIFQLDNRQVEAVLPGATDGISAHEPSREWSTFYRTDTLRKPHSDSIMTSVVFESIMKLYYITLVCVFTTNRNSSLLYLDLKKITRILFRNNTDAHQTFRAIEICYLVHHEDVLFCL